MFSDNSMDLELYLDITRMNINRSHDGFRVAHFIKVVVSGSMDIV